MHIMDLQNSIMKGPNKTLLNVTLGIFLASITLFGCDSKSMIPELFHQCIASFERIEINPRLTEGLVVDTEQQCFAARWNIPPAYKPYVPRKSKNETLELVVGLPELTPGALLASNRVRSENPLVKIDSLRTASFPDFLRDRKEAFIAGYQLHATDFFSYGRQVYEAPKDHVISEVLFFPIDENNPMVRCLVGAGEGFDDIDPKTPCTVISKINDDFYAEYRLVYSLIADLEPINADLINLIRSFISP